MNDPGALRRGFLVGLLTLALVPVDRAAAQDDGPSAFPESMPEAIRVYEENVAPSDWASGPVEYIMLDYERDIWNSLDVDEQRSAFQEWFWDRRDLDPRDDDHEVREEFYERVAYANQRFSGFPRGWRSDRGRVWIVLGAPSGGMRRTSLRNYGRCSAAEGEWWTYYTQNMAFQASFGEFNVVFVESRVGQYEICDPTMMGVGAYPVELRQALEITRESLIRDSVTEFDPTGAIARSGVGVLPVRDMEAGVDALDVPRDAWAPFGVAGSVVLPIEIPLRDLLFEPVGEQLRATLLVEAGLLGLGGEEGRSGAQEWQVEIGAGATDIGAASLRTAIVLPAEAGGYAAQLRITDPLSGQARVWEDAVEVRADGEAVSPPLVGRELIQLRADGEIAVLAARPAVLAPGEPFVVVSWVRGVTIEAERVGVVLLDSDNLEVPVTVDQAAWGNQAAAGPLVVQATLPDLAPGRYSLRLSLGSGPTPEEVVVEVR